jgi:hypothetical protein
VARSSDPILTAAQAAVRKVCRDAAAVHRAPDPAIDVTPVKAVDALKGWVAQEAGKPGVYWAQGARLMPRPGQGHLYLLDGAAANGPIDLSQQHTGSTIWTVANCTVQGRVCTMLMGVVRLADGNWLLFRRVAVARGTTVIFEFDSTWYHNRVKRSKQRTGGGGR